MIKKLGYLLIKAGERILGEEKALYGYDVKKVGIGLTYTKKDRTKWQKEYKMSQRVANKAILKDTKNRVALAIFRALKSHIEYKVIRSGDVTVVEGSLNMYIHDDEKTEGK